MAAAAALPGWSRDMSVEGDERAEFVSEVEPWSRVQVTWVSGSDSEDDWQNVNITVEDACFSSGWDKGRDSCSDGYLLVVGGERGADKTSGGRGGSYESSDGPVTPELKAAFVSVLARAHLTPAELTRLVQPVVPRSIWSGCHVAARILACTTTTT